MRGTEAFFRTARERQSIYYRQLYYRKEMEAQDAASLGVVCSEFSEEMLTHDPILGQYRFCNVFREQDKVTEWVQDHVREPLKTNPRLVQALTVARFINRPETLELLRGSVSRDAPIGARSMMCWWDHDEVARRIAAERPGLPIVTGAYMVKTPLRKPKLEGLSEIFEPIMAEKNLYTDVQATGSIQAATELMCTFPWVGPFMAYEITSDLRHTPVLSHAVDILTWGNPGPGAARGASRVLLGSPDSLSRSSRTDLGCIHEVMRQLREDSQREEFWSSTWPAWEMREVEHWLCEFDKYERARLGEGRPKQKYPAP